MESPPPNFPQGYSWTPPCHLCSPPSHFLLSSPIFILLWSQFSPTRPCFSLGPLPSSRETFQLLSTSPQVLKVLYLEPHYKWGSWLKCWCWCGIYPTT